MELLGEFVALRQQGSHIFLIFRASQEHMYATKDVNMVHSKYVNKRRRSRHMVFPNLASKCHLSASKNENLPYFNRDLYSIDLFNQECPEKFEHQKIILKKFVFGQTSAEVKIKLNSEMNLKMEDSFICRWKKLRGIRDNLL